MAELLIGTAFLRVAIRRSCKRSDFDQNLNAMGMAALVVGVLLIP